jgi:hypothetical protein
MALSRQTATVPSLTELLDEKLDNVVKEFAKAAGIPGVSLAVHRHGSCGGAAEEGGGQHFAPRFRILPGCILLDIFQLTDQHRSIPSAVSLAGSIVAI